MKLSYKFYLAIFLLILNFNSSFFLYAQEANNNDFEEVIDYSNLDLDDLELETRSNGGIDFNTLMQAVQKIEAPLWLITKPPRGRDALYLIPQRLNAIEYGGLVFNIFYNYTDDMAMRPNEIFNLEINQPALEEFIKALNKSLTSQEASSVIPLFKNFTLQERKAGALIQGGFYSGPFIFQLNTSLQFAERNFWLTQKEQNRLKSLFSETGDSLDTKEFYKTKFGMGDTRLKLGLNTLNMSNFQMDIGFEGIVPTSIISSIPRLQSYSINLENFEDDLPTVLYSIRDNLINPRIGNGGHFGLGCYMEAKVDLFHDAIQLWNRISFDNFFTAQEDRLILSAQTIPPPAQDLANFLNVISSSEGRTEFIKQYIFPPPYRVSVKPGSIINYVLNATFEPGKNIGFGIGYDYYGQQEEHIEKIYTENIDPNTLRLSDAELINAQQHKIFGEINYSKSQKNWKLVTALGGDYTFSAKNMGNDWTIFIRIGGSF
ncbi:hypothetical protein GF322_04245 [Candidatus Dependentiae bacterium]|nr:hypothetical protein [Candidatus Dependentiae bacterium]